MKSNFVALILSLFIFSCDDGSPEPLLRGDLIGSISIVMDEFGKPMTDRSGYVITLEGSDSPQQAESDAAGHFVFKELKAGIYNLVFSKPAFETHKVFSLKFTGGDIPTYYNAPLLSQLSTTSVKDFAIAVTEEGNVNPSKYTMLKIEVTTEPEATLEKPRNLAVYVHTAPSVSGTIFSFSQIQITESNSLIRLNKIESGTKLYAIAYPVPVSCNLYYDPDLGGYLNPCLGLPTDVVEFTVP